MEEMRLTLALGSNMGDREENIRTALKELESVFGRPIELSDMLETAAVGFEAPDFINSVAVYRCSLDPYEVLSECKRIERKMGRTDLPEWDASGNRVYHNRIIDIDILTYGETSMSEKDLVIPHPAVFSRPFIKELLLNLRPL